MPPYQWQVAAQGFRIAVDPTRTSHAILSNDAPAPGTTLLEVVVTDAAMKHTRVTLPLQARDNCWFAFTALDATGPALHLLDPLAEVPIPVALQNNQGVYDFQFSPDGRFLAYRFGASAAYPTGTHLALVTLSSLHEQVLAFAEDAVTAFAWSPDSTLLAVAFSNVQGSFLTATRLPSAGSNDTAPVELPPVPALVQSDLFWVQNEFVAFHAELLPDLGHVGQWLPNPFHERTPFYVRLGSQGFGQPVAITSTSFERGVFLQPTDSGFFMLDSGDGASFNPLSPTLLPPVATGFANLISPSGSYSAELIDGQLQVFSAEEGDLAPPAAVSKLGEDCPMLLAWAKGRERIACVADVPNDATGKSHGEVRIFDLDPTSPTQSLSMSPLQGFCTDDSSTVTGSTSCAALPDKYGYGQARAAGLARGFSPSGRWLAFTTADSDLQGDNFLYWADLNQVPIALKRKVYPLTSGLTATAPTELSFSPDERFLILHRGNELIQLDLTASSEPSQTPMVLSQSMLSESPCTEDFLSAPDHWCGNTDRSAPLYWSPDSQALAFRTTGAVAVVDVSQFPANVRYPLPAPDCKQRCTGQFAFQPRINP